MARKMVETTPVSTRITKPMQKAISDLLKINAHVNVADYLRDLIRKDLEVRGVKFEGKESSAPEIKATEAPEK